MKIDDHINDYFLFQDAKFEPQQILNIEEKCGIRLSSDYKNFALKYGGVDFATSAYSEFMQSPAGEKYSFIEIPNETTAKFEIESHRELRTISIRSMHFAPEVINDYIAHTTGGVWEDVEMLFPKFLVPIASDAGDNLYLIEDASDGGRIFFWERSEDEWGTNSNIVVGLVADSFNSFIEGIKVGKCLEVGADDVYEVN